MEEKQPLNDTHTCKPTPPTSSYSLTSGPLSRPRAHPIAGTPSTSPPTGGPGDRPSSPPSAQPADHINTFLCQLGSSISALKAAFTLMQASPSSPCASSTSAETAIAEELETLSHLHMKLSSLIQQQDFDMKQDSSDEIAHNQSIQGPHVGAILKSYEGIISRFHDEIRKKDAVTEALKETLAKSMLKVEKLERRLKAAKAHSPPEQLK